MKEGTPTVISFADAKQKRLAEAPIVSADEVTEFMYEYNLVIKVTKQNKIYALFQTYDTPVSEEDQAVHLHRILQMMKKSNPEITLD